MFYSDRPIKSKKDDRLGRDGFAKLLAQSLINLNSTDTFAVGLYGKWGSGKTSLVNMTLDEIEIQQKNEFIVVRFEPWNFSNTDQLLSQFFIRLSNEFCNKGDEKLLKIGKALEVYSDAFDLAKPIPYVGEMLALFGKKGILALSRKMKKGADEKDILKQKEYVIDLLKKQSKKILVVIDDIDRLSSEQIRQIFQLITSVAKFPNTIYLLVFDKEIVVKALQKMQEGNGEDYLEKIIQMPIQIPNIPRIKLRKIMIDQLNQILSENTDTSFQQQYWERLFESCIEPLIKNLRDVNRLCNSLQFKLTSISSEVNFTDMVAISVLEIFLPQIYEWVKQNKSILTGEHDFSGVARNRTQDEWYELYYTQLQSLLHNSDSENKRDAEISITFLSYLFPYFGQKIGKVYEVNDLTSFMRNNQIAHPDKFDRYFNLDLDSIVFRKSEIMKSVYSLSCEDFGKYLLERDEEGTSFDFLEEVRAMISEISLDRAKIIINALLNTSSKLNVVSNKKILSLSSSFYAVFTIIDLLELVPSNERYVFLSDIIYHANFFSLQSMANIIKAFELGYGRLAANGQERNYKKLISLEELIQLENVFTQKTKEILEYHNLFDFGDWKTVLYLLENFDSNYVKEYLAHAFSDDKNIAKYLEDSVATWIGGDIEYEITDKYKQYLTEERILQSIKALKDSSDLFSMPEQIQRECGAFFIHGSGKVNNVSQSEVDGLLNDWKNEK